MIAGLIGVIDGRTADSVLVNVQGVVYRVGTSSSTLVSIGDPGDSVRLYTYLVVREDQLSLYGFSDPAELVVFETLIGITGVGPRLACAILSRFNPDRLNEAIQAGDADLLATVPGVGKKTAGRLILELRGKLPQTAASGGPVGPADEEVVAALRALGYTVAEASAAASKVTTGPGATIEERIVEALRSLG